MATGHKFKALDTFKVASGRVYRIDRIRTDDHPKFKGEPGYDAHILRNGDPFGPSRIFPESKLLPIE